MIVGQLSRIGTRYTAIALSSAVVSGPVAAQTSEPPSPIVFDLPESTASGRLMLHSDALKDGTVPEENSSYGANRSPAIRWDAPPKGTQSFVLFVEDPDGNRDGAPVRHWMAFDIDPATRSLEAGLAPDAASPAMIQGTNVRNTLGYAGPHPKRGSTHHYHFELFALDRKVALASDAKREAVVAAMAGHVLAKGQIVAAYTGH